MSPNLIAVENKIARVLSTKPECFITHPTELAALKSMSPEEIEEFALDHGWRVVFRLGGRQIEFYNDAGARELTAARFRKPVIPSPAAAGSRDPVEVTLKIPPRDSSVRAGLAFSLGMKDHATLRAE